MGLVVTVKVSREKEISLDVETNISIMMLEHLNFPIIYGKTNSSQLTAARIHWEAQVPPFL